MSFYNQLCKYSCGIITRLTVQRFWTSSDLRALYKLNLSIILRRSHVEDLNTDLFHAKVLIRGFYMLSQALRNSRNSSLAKLESLYGTFGRCWISPRKWTENWWLFAFCVTKKILDSILNGFWDESCQLDGWWTVWWTIYIPRSSPFYAGLLRIMVHWLWEIIFWP